MPRNRILAALAIALLTACNYGLSGGGGFPSNVRTVYIAPFENKTPQFDLDQQLFRQLTEKLPRALGVRAAGEQSADAIVRGRILSYRDEAQNYRPGDQGNVRVVQHQIMIMVAIQIVDVKNNVILWESQSLSGRGEYQPDSQPEDPARTKALESIVQQVIDGAQSQW